MFEKKTIFIVIFLIFVLSSFDVFSQESELPLIRCADALRMVRDNSDDIRIAELNKRISKNSATSSVVSSFVPSLSVSSTLAGGVMYPMADGTLSEWAWRDGYPDIGVTASLAIGSTTVTNAIISGMQKALADFTYDQTISNLEKALWAAYWGVSSLNRSVAVAEKVVAASEDALQAAQARFDAGLVSSLELMNAKLASANAKKSCLSLKKSRENAYMSLKSLLKRKDDFDVEPFLGHVSLSFPSVEVVYNRHIASNATIRSLALASDMASSAATATNLAARLPRVSLSLSYGYRGRYSNVQYGIDDTLTFSVAASLGLDGFIPHTSTYNSISEANAKAEIAKLNLSAGYDSYRREIESGIRNLEALEAACEVASLQVEYASESARLSADAYQNGKITSQSYADALNAMLQAEVSLANSEFDYQNSAYSLSIYLGEDYESFMARYAVVKD